MSSDPASAKPAASPPSDPKDKDNDFAETAVKVAGIALATAIGVGLLRSRKVQEKVEGAVDDASTTKENIDLKMRGAQVVGEADRGAEDLRENVEDSVDKAGKEAKNAASGFFGRAKKTARKVKQARRGLTVEKGDTLWGLSRRYNVPVDVIQKSNAISGDTIIVGQELVLPGAGLFGED